METVVGIDDSGSWNGHFSFPFILSEHAFLRGLAVFLFVPDTRASSGDEKVSVYKRAWRVKKKDKGRKAKMGRAGQGMV